MLNWEKLSANEGGHYYRCQVIGGWLVMVVKSGGMSITFVPDPSYQWD